MTEVKKPENKSHISHRVMAEPRQHRVSSDSNLTPDTAPAAPSGPATAHTENCVLISLRAIKNRGQPAQISE